MGAVTPEELARLWSKEEVTTERAVGQIVQQLVTMQECIERQAKTIVQLRTDIATLTAQVGDCSGKVRRVRREQ